MADAPAVGAGTEEAPAPAGKSKVGYETVLAVAGALIAGGFFLPWFDLPGDGGGVSGLDIVRTGGIWTGVAAIPVLGLATAVFGGLRWRLSRWFGLATAVMMIVPVAYLLVLHWPWLYTIPLVLGAAAVVMGKLGRTPWLNLPLGGVLLVASVVGPLVAGDEPVFDFVEKAAEVDKSDDKKKSDDDDDDDKKKSDDDDDNKKSDDDDDDDDKKGDDDDDKKKSDDEAPMAPASPLLTVSVGMGMVEGLGFALAGPLVLLGLLIPFCAVWLLWSGFRKKGLERPQAFTGWSIIGLTAYVAALVAFGPTLMTSGVGLWMTALGGCVLLLGSRPFKTRKKRKKAPKEAPQPKPTKADKKAAKARAKAEKAAEKAAAKANESAPESTKDDADAAKTAAEAPKADGKDAKTDGKDAKADKLAAAKAKKIAELKAKRAAMAKAEKAEAAAEKAADKAAAKEEAATAKAGAKLASEPEPTFAADPTAAAKAPENEDRESLMKRMGVKKPPPPSDNELEDMLAALKKRAGDD